ncbi:MAG: hypothetical protein BZ138_08055 [Methanosphaera sp. rholeuAM270]|nr:MAG: hypothetical protein BZ138_08055 [Methanosphaera sp. rholeuAM270]
MGLDQWINYITDDGDVHEFYYRKENWLRNWMEENTMLNSESNCEKIVIHPTQINELHQACEQVLDNHELADELLPTQCGFFYGSTDYDEWYFEGVELVKNHMEEIMNMEENVLIVTYEDWW